MAYVAEGKCKGFLSLCVQRHFDYSDSYWPLLRDVEIKPGWNNTLMIFWPLYTDITATRVVAWVIVVLKLAYDSDIAQIIISDSSESEGKQLKVPFCRNHWCLGGLWFHRKWTSLCTAKTCLDLATHWYTEKHGKSVMFLSVPLIFPRLSRANG